MSIEFLELDAEPEDSFALAEIMRRGNHMGIPWVQEVITDPSNPRRVFLLTGDDRPPVEQQLSLLEEDMILLQSIAGLPGERALKERLALFKK